ncbi:MAG: DNA polymerase IV [Eubacteriales bacterium]|nr:DNA polymerase IV [Eubacteriales bacterium]
MERLIFHVDVNSAYLSWEAARRVQEGEEDLRLIPSCIGGNPEKRTGIVLAKSIPAKRFGVQTGEPLGMALRKCPELKIAQPDFRLYEQCSDAFMEICRSYAPELEKFSIDECFLDMTGTGQTYPDPIATAHEIKDTIRDTLGFTVNVGIGPNKLLAKMASDFEKPDRVHTLFAREIPQKLWPLPVGDLLTVGRTTAEKLKRAGIVTIGDLAKQDSQRIQALVGNKLGMQLHCYANGMDDAQVQSGRQEAKGYSVSTTLEENVTGLEQANRIFLTLADSVSARMRADQAKAYCISVSIRTNTFQNRSHQHKLDIPTDITSEIYTIAKELFSELWDGKTPLRLLGLSLSDIAREEAEQLSLFPDRQREKAQKLDRAVDAIRQKYGVDTIARASVYDSSQRIGRKYRAQLERKKKE